MSQPRSEYRVPRPRLGAALTAAIALGLLSAAGALASLPADRGEDTPLPPAQSWSDRGVDPELAGEQGRLRVRILLSSQPLLEAADRPELQEQLQPAPDPRTHGAAVASPARIAPAEKAAARAAERTYEQAVEQLQPAADDGSAAIERLAGRIRHRGGEILDRELIPAAVVARVRAGELEQLAALEGVQAIDPAPIEKPLSGVGTQAVGAPSWWAAGYTGGTGVSDTVSADAAVGSELPDPSHPAFAGLPIDNDPGITSGTDDHATHVAGVMASRDSTYRGVAYGVDRLVNGGDPYVLGFTYNGVAGAPDPAEVINTSFGGAATSENGDDGDDVTTAFFGVSEALAASNENTDGSPTVANIGRNTMSVAAFNDNVTVESTDDVVLGDSSRGPTPGGRKKPDLTAPGGSVVAPSAFWNSSPPCGSTTVDPDGTCADFTGRTGTSFSSPHVAGAMTLLEGAGITDPIAQRALLINSARDWNGTNTGLHGWTAGTQTGWRPEVGWGELDLNMALAQRANYRLGSVREGEAAFYRATVPPGAKATMAFQLRGYFSTYPAPGPAGTFKYTQSDLDLRQYRADATEVFPPAAFDPPDTTIDPGPNALDPNDTVEQVRSPAGATQQITYKVQSASTIDGASSEPFSIAAAAALTPLASPTARPSSTTTSPSGPVRCSTPVTISTTLVNDSPDLAASGATASIELPAGVELVSGPEDQIVSGGTLATSATSEPRSWVVQATTDGAKTITLSGRGSAYDTPFTRSTTIALDADCIPPETTIDSGPGGLTSDPSPSFALSAQGGATGFECSIDGGAFATCTSPASTGNLAEGRHTFAARAIDAAGNADPSPAERGFVIDRSVSGTRLSAIKKQRFGGALAAKVRARLGEGGSVRATATVPIGGRNLKTKTARADLEAAKSTRLRLRASRTVNRAITRALRRGRLRLSVRATFVDELGNRRVLRRKIRLR